MGKRVCHPGSSLHEIHVKPLEEGKITDELRLLCGVIQSRSSLSDVSTQYEQDLYLPSPRRGLLIVYSCYVTVFLHQKL